MDDGVDLPHSHSQLLPFAHILSLLSLSIHHLFTQPVFHSVLRGEDGFCFLLSLFSGSCLHLNLCPPSSLSPSLSCPQECFAASCSHTQKCFGFHRLICVQLTNGPVKARPLSSPMIPHLQLLLFALITSQTQRRECVWCVHLHSDILMLTRLNSSVDKEYSLKGFLLVVVF